MSDISNRVAVLFIVRLDPLSGPIVSEGSLFESPIWCFEDSIIDRLVRSDPFFTSKPSSAIDVTVMEILRMSRIQRIANCNVLCRDYGWRR